MDNRVIPLGLSNCAVAEGSHILFPYAGSADSLIEPAVQYAQVGLDQGDCVACILPQAHLDSVRSSLRGAASAIASNRLFLVPGQEFYLDDGRFSPVATVEKWRHMFDSTERLRVFGTFAESTDLDMVTLYKIAEYESRLNLGDNFKLLMCAFGMDTVQSSVFDTISAAHPYIYDGVSVKANAGYLAPREFSNHFYRCEECEFIYTSEPRCCRVARLDIANIASRMPFDMEEIDDILLAVGEAFANAVRHGSPSGCQNRIIVRVQSSDEGIIIEITDEGCGITCEPSEINWGEPGGKGLYLMRTVCDDMQYMVSTSGCTVKLVKKTSRGRL